MKTHARVPRLLLMALMLAVFAAALGIWQVSATAANEYTFPPMTDVAERAWVEWRSEPFLEGSNLEAHRRLGDPEAVSGLGEAPSLHHCAERCELPCVHKRSLWRM